MTLVAALTLPALPALLGGCGRTACFEYTQGEYEQHGGQCPSGADALANLTPTGCPGAVQKVMSKGSFDGQLCCYSVQQDDSTDCEFGSGDAVGGIGGGNVETSGFAVAGGFGGTSPGGVGGAGGAPNEDCLHCDSLLIHPNLTGNLCSSSAKLLSDLDACACNTACQAACGSTLCNGKPESDACTACLTDPAKGCGVEHDACAADK